MIARAASGRRRARATVAAAAMPSVTRCRVERHADHAGRRDQHLSTDRRRRRAPPRRPSLRAVVMAVGAGAGVGAAAVDRRPRAHGRRTPAAAPSRRAPARHGLVRREHRRADAGGSLTISARSSPFDFLMPHATPAARKPSGAVTLPSIVANTRSVLTAGPVMPRRGEGAAVRRWCAAGPPTAGAARTDRAAGRRRRGAAGTRRTGRSGGTGCSRRSRARSSRAPRRAARSRTRGARSATGSWVKAQSVT